VVDRGEQLGHRRPAHPLSGAVGRDQFGEVGLQLLELPDELVVLEVGDLGLVEHVVAVRVVVDLLPELLDPRPRVGEPALLRLGGAPRVPDALFREPLASRYEVVSASARYSRGAQPTDRVYRGGGSSARGRGEVGPARRQVVLGVRPRAGGRARVRAHEQAGLVCVGAGLGDPAEYDEARGEEAGTRPRKPRPRGSPGRHWERGQLGPSVGRPELLRVPQVGAGRVLPTQHESGGGVRGVAEYPVGHPHAEPGAGPLAGGRVEHPRKVTDAVDAAVVGDRLAAEQVELAPDPGAPSVPDIQVPLCRRVRIHPGAPPRSGRHGRVVDLRHRHDRARDDPAHDVHLRTVRADGGLPDGAGGDRFALGRPGPGRRVQPLHVPVRNEPRREPPRHVDLAAQEDGPGLHDRPLWVSR